MKLKQATPEYFARVRLEIEGDFPSKKNELKPGGKGRGYHYDRVTSKQIEDMTTQVRIQWGPRPPCRPAQVEISLEIFNPAKDADGVWTTIIDTLKKAGVIVDDNVRDYNPLEKRNPVVTSRLLASDRAIVVIDFPVELTD